MAGGGWRTFTAGAVLTAAQVQSYLMDQTNQVYATAAARTAALGTAVAEGMVSYRTDGKTLEKYNGTSWIPVADNIYATAAARGSVTSVEGQIAYLSTTDATNDTANQLDFYNGSAWESVKTSQNNAMANGDFSKWSRGTSFTAQQYTVPGADRWYTYRGSGSLTQVSRQATGDTTNLPNIQYAARIGRSSTDAALDAILFSQSFETVNSIPFAGKTVTLSWYARKGSGFSATSSALGYQVLTGTGTDQNELTGYTGSVSVANSTVTLTTTWQRFSTTFNIGSTATEMGFHFNYTPVGTSVSNDYFEVTGVQLEAGTVASPFRPSGGNTALDTATAGSAGFDGVLVSTNSATNPSGSGTPAWAGFDVAGKNKVINGGFDFWQRGTSFANPNATTSFNADRFIGFRGSLVTGMTVSRQSASLTGFTYCARIARNSGDTSTQPLYFDANTIETLQATGFQGSAVTISFYARAGANYSGGSSFSATVTSGTGTDQSITGFTNPTTVATGSASLTTTWQRFSYTGVFPSNGTEAKVEWSYTPTGTAGANDYYEITGVQLEPGSVATPFSRAGGTLQGELAACQRYFQRTTDPYICAGWNSSTTRMYGVIPFPVTMRTAPTLSVTGTTNFSIATTSNIAVATLALDNAGPTRTSITATVASGLTAGGGSGLFSNNASVYYLDFSAEL